MRKLSLLFPALALTLFLGSCSSSGGDEETPTETPQPQAAQPASTPAPAATPADQAQTPAEGEEEPSDILAGGGGLVSPVFIPATDPEARRQNTAEGRVDPFSDFSPPSVSGVKFAPEPEPEGGAAPQQAVPNVPNVPNVNAGNGSGTAGDAAANLLDSVASISDAIGDFSPVLPQLPTADLAEGTEVTGVVQLGGVDNIMLKAPNEQYSRYVQVGDVIADGQVTVKRVEFRRNSPVVVLEQFGIEVYKEIEDALLASAKKQDPNVAMVSSKSSGDSVSESLAGRKNALTSLANSYNNVYCEAVSQGGSVNAASDLASKAVAAPLVAARNEWSISASELIEFATSSQQC